MLDPHANYRPVDRAALRHNRGYVPSSVVTLVSFHCLMILNQDYKKEKAKLRLKIGPFDRLLGSAMSACSWRTRPSLPPAQRHSRSQGIILLRSLSNVRAASSRGKCGNVRSTCLTVLSMVVTCHVTHRAMSIWPYSHERFFFFSGMPMPLFPEATGNILTMEIQTYWQWKYGNPCN